MRDNILVYGLLILAALALVIAMSVNLARQHGAEEIQTFEGCAKAGYPILESYPRQCRTPDGRAFIEILQPTEPAPADPIEPSPAPGDGFCGRSTKGTCLTDADCGKGGCSGQVCQSRKQEPVITTCEYRDCYNAGQYGMQCGCVNQACQWH
jgi:eight-cysteine-cluster-containing protein